MRVNNINTKSIFVILLVFVWLLASETNGETSVYSTTELYAELLRELYGAHLRISASHSPNAMLIEPNSLNETIYRGYLVDACDYMAKAFGFNYSFIHTRTDEVQKFGIKEASVRMLLRNEVDVAATDVLLSFDHFRRMSVSIPLFSGGVALIVPWPDVESRLLAPFRIFDQTVWLAIFGTIAAMTLTSALLPKFHEKIMLNKTTQLKNSLMTRFEDALFDITANLTSHQGAWKSFRKQQLLFYRILLGTWCLTVFVLVIAYSTLLITYLTLPKLMPASKSFDDLANGRPQKLTLITENNGYAAQYMLAATYGLHKLIGDSLREHPETLFNTPKEKFDLLYTGNYAYPTNQQTFYTLLDALNKKAGYCRFTASTKRMPDIREVYYVLCFQKNWRYSDAIRNKIQWWTDSGLAMHWIKSYQPRDKGCLLDDYKKNSAKQRVLQLVDLSSAFAVLGLGFGMSFLVFLLEICYRKMLT